jgi:N6-adenosine-specific RNA methylase IME4
MNTNEDVILSQNPTDLLEQTRTYLQRVQLALQESTDFDEILDIRDRGELFRQYSRQQRYGIEIQNTGAEIKIRAERRMGELLREIKEDGELQHGGDRKSESRFHRATLNDIGISRTQSFRWQRAASLPNPIFEAYIRETKERQEEITTNAVLAIVQARLKEERIQEIVNTPSDTSTIDDLYKLIDAGKRFGTILADPPWRYGNQATRASTNNHYRTMTVDEIAALPIDQLAADDSHLHLWVPNAFLFEAKDVMDAWGFTYKSVFVWCKPTIGLGNYWRVATEFLLLGVRGNCPFLDQSQINWIEAERESHSTKPEVIRALIEKVSPPPRLELFARRVVEGWTCWGAEVNYGIESEGAENYKERKR